MSNGIEFCINGGQDGPIEKTVELWKACDDGGVHLFGIPDSAVRSPELYSLLTLCALRTSPHADHALRDEPDYAASLGDGLRDGDVERHRPGAHRAGDRDRR